MAFKYEMTQLFFVLVNNEPGRDGSVDLWGVSDDNGCDI